MWHISPPTRERERERELAQLALEVLRFMTVAGGTENTIPDRAERGRALGPLFQEIPKYYKYMYCAPRKMLLCFDRNCLRQARPRSCNTLFCRQVHLFHTVNF